MLRGSALVCAALLALIAASPPSGKPTPTPDAEAERIFARTREYWRSRTDVPYVRYGALVRYLHEGHVFDNWWDTYYRTSDGAESLKRLVDPEEEKQRLAGFPISIFGIFKIGDTNPDAEPIRLDEPRIEPTSSFGILPRVLATAPLPVASDGSGAPRPAESPLREISRVEALSRDYQVTLVGKEPLHASEAYHLRLEPLHDPKINRLRELWVDATSYATLQIVVQGILNGKPYDGVKWTISYVQLEDRYYVQQIRSDEPLRFGLDTVIPQMEFDFVDYHFPVDVPQFTFEKLL